MFVDSISKVNMAQQNVTTDAKHFTLPNQLNLPSGKRKLSRTKQVKLVRSQNLLDDQLFEENKNFYQDELEYPRNGTEPGLVLIFNQENFSSKDRRFGSVRDVNEIMLCFSRLGFNIREEHIFSDYTRDEIFKAINNVLEDDLVLRVNSIIVFFLTHGDTNNLLRAQDVSFNIEEVVQIFGNCKRIENKPKLFVIQACKGENATTTNNTNTNVSKLVSINLYSERLYPDMLIVCSTSEGNVSFRDPIKGTWYIQELCKNFAAYGRRDSVTSLLLRTTKCVCSNYYTQNKNEDVVKQLPVFVSTLRRKFYLNRSKDRSFLIGIEKNFKDINTKLDVLSNKLNEVNILKRKM